MPELSLAAEKGAVCSSFLSAIHDNLFSTRSDSSQRWRGQAWLLRGLALLGAVWFFWTAGVPTFGYFSAGAPGYYGAQTAGFLHGHTHVAIEPTAGLLALSDPYDPIANAPYRVHDMTLWNRKYYLYYGVSPVLVLFLPFYLITGSYPTEAWAVAFFCSVGLATGLGLLGTVRRRFFPAAPTWSLLAGGLVLVLASPVAVLTEAVQFYQVPIAGAFALHLLMLAAIYRALAAKRASWAWLAVGSGLFGLTIGSRPNYLLSGFALVVPWLVLVKRERMVGWLRYGVAAFGPAFVGGLGILCYNWVRFGSPSEFGMKYTLGGERIPDLKLMGLENVVPHLWDYLLQGGNWSRYFPFFSAPAGAPHGALRYGPWLLLFPMLLELGKDRWWRGSSAFAWTIATAALANLALLTCFFGLTDRYPSDYVPGALLLASMGALALGERWRDYRFTVWMGGCLAGVTIFCGVAVWMKRFPQPDRLFGLARMANYPTHWWEQWRGESPGSMMLELELPEGQEGRTEPILHTGFAADRRDWLQIAYLPEGRAKISFFHAGLGLVDGSTFKVRADRKVRMDVQLGALLPPKAHPMFRTWSDAEYHAARRTLNVKVNDQIVLDAAMDSYESTPEDQLIGRTRWSANGVEPAFTGKILALTRSARPRPTLPKVVASSRTPFELKLRFPADRASGRDPLVITGSGNRFDVLFVEYSGLGKVAFGLYHHGDELVMSPIMSVDVKELHTLQVWMGSLAVPEVATNEEGELPNSRRISVVLDGTTALNREQVFYPAEPSSVTIGENALVGDVVGSAFFGRIESVEPVAFEVLPDPGLLRQYGAVDMTVVFARGAQGASEPLVVTGIAGAGDFIYVRYLEGGKMTFAFDHWGIGGLVGKPVEVDTWKPHRLRMTMGSLYPPGEDVGEWRTRVQVKLDDTVVLDGSYAVHPSTRTQVRIGENAIGGSTCGPRFSGQIQKIERPARPEQ